MIEINMFSNIGNRTQQQDRCGAYRVNNAGTEQIVAFVSDGIGGTEDGSIASSIMEEIVKNRVVSFGEEVDPGQLLLEIVDEGCAKVKQAYFKNQGITTGATFVGVVITGASLKFCSIGDSRIYLFRQGKLLQLNREHNYLRSLMVHASRGTMNWQEAVMHPQGTSLTQFIGMEQFCVPDFNMESIALTENDMILLMSDGVFGVLSEQEMEKILSFEQLEATMHNLENEVLKKAYEEQDNFTCVCLKMV